MAFQRGDLVQTMFDTGAMGYSILYGVVIQAGAKTALVVWESSLRNRIRHDTHQVKLAEDQAEARRYLAMREVEMPAPGSLRLQDTRVSLTWCPPWTYDGCGAWFQVDQSWCDK